MKKLFYICSVLLLQSSTIWADTTQDWQAMGNTLYFSLKAAEKQFHWKSFYEKSTNRLVIEFPNKKTDAFLINHSEYGIVDNQFIVNKGFGGDPFLEEKANQLFLAKDFFELAKMLSQEEYAWFQNEMKKYLEAPKVLQTESLCVIQRPVHKVFIDPGHGGEDWGTKFGRTFEKNIVLQFAKTTQKKLTAAGFEVKLSRNQDLFLPLDIRPRIALDWQADVFISIHVNNSPVYSAHGTETYILNQDATDQEARKLAVLENSVLKKVEKSSDPVKDILWDMEQTAYLQDSAFLAADIQQSIVKSAHQILGQTMWKNRGVRQAPFSVLSHAAMPAILVELGYLSNQKDRILLTDDVFQQKLAEALVNGVKEFAEHCRRPL